MRWIDIELPSATTCPESDRLLDETCALVESIPHRQAQDGLDTPAIAALIEQAGRLLFSGVTAGQTDAFRPDRDRPGATTPGHSDRIGYHIVAPPNRQGLPWHWLHNGVNFLLEKHPVVVATHGSRVPEIDPPRLWMQRHSDALFEPESGESTDRARPEILFVPGHTKEEVRRLIFREAEGIDDALAATGQPSARLRIPGAVTPGLLAARAMLYQALHFAAPTSQPPEVSQAGENRWLAGLMAAAGQPAPETVDELVGLDLDVIGVDPVEAVLDEAAERYAHRGVAAHAGARRAGTTGVSENSWLLADGPVLPEHLGRSGCLPPLVFANSWCSLNWLGQRFLAAGASAFLGTAIPLFSRPARLYAALFYEALARNHCVGAAHRQSALALRERLGATHPAWLAYGIQGYGTLRLADL